MLRKKRRNKKKMAKVIKLTPELQEEARRAFEREISSAKCRDGIFEFRMSFPKAEARKATVVYEPRAWQKLFLLLDRFDTEVAWHGIVTRDPDESKDAFIVHDILVYPQKVTGTNVDTDQDELENWLFSLEPEQRRNLRLHGHSHVRMGTSPSGTDLEHQRDMLNQVTGDGFYIFQIWNKSHSVTSKIYDLRRNLLFEDNDVDTVLSGDGFSADDFIRSAKTQVKEQTYASSWQKSGSYYSGSSYAGSNAKATAAKPADNKSVPAKSTPEQQKKLIPASDFRRSWGSSCEYGPVCDGDDDDDEDDELLGAYTGKGYSGSLSSGYPYYNNGELDVWAALNT